MLEAKSEMKRFFLKNSMQYAVCKHAETCFCGNTWKYRSARWPQSTRPIPVSKCHLACGEFDEGLHEVSPGYTPIPSWKSVETNTHSFPAVHIIRKYLFQTWIIMREVILIEQHGVDQSIDWGQKTSPKSAAWPGVKRIVRKKFLLW